MKEEKEKGEKRVGGGFPFLKRRVYRLFKDLVTYICM